MAKTDNLQDYLTAMANSFRSATNSNNPINAQEMIGLPQTLANGYEDYKKLITLNYPDNSDISIPLGITKIEQYRFYNPTSITKFLNKITIPDGVTEIGNYNFNKHSYKELHIPPTLTNIGTNCFLEKQSKTYPKILHIKDLIQFLLLETKSDIFAYQKPSEILNVYPDGCNVYLNNEPVTDVVVPKNLTIIRKKNYWYIAGDFSFEEETQINEIGGTPNCNRLYLPKGPYTVIGVGNSNEYHYNGTWEDYMNLTFTNTGASMFAQNPYIENDKKFYFNGELLHDLIVIPDGVTEIKDYSLCGFDLSGIKEVIIPASVTKIGKQALQCASANKGIIRMLGTTPPTLTNGAIVKNYTEKIIVPSSALSVFKSTTNWSVLADIIVPDTNVSVTIDSTLLNNENILYSVDGREKQQFTNETLSLVGVGTLTIYNTSTDTIKLGKTSGGNEVGTSGPNTTITFTFTDVSTLYITKA